MKLYACKHLLILSVKLQIHAWPSAPHQHDNSPLDTQQGFQTSKTEQKTWAELDHISPTDIRMITEACKLKC